ncbi:MAG: hypothetical protein E4G89_07410 [Methanothrix sp.]|nr:MAG: hypothetical protein E4G89_07410 [Methanothrix sp.]
MKGKMGCSKCGMMKCSCGGKVGKMMYGGKVDKMMDGGSVKKMGGGGKLLKMLSPAAALASSLKSGEPEGLMAVMPIGAMMKQGRKPAASVSNKTVRGAKTMASGGRINGAAKRGHTKGKMC